MYLLRKTVLAAGLAASLAGGFGAADQARAQSQCIDYGPRTDGGTGVSVSNHCGRPVTFVVYGPGSMDYLNLRPNSSFNWTTGRFSEWKACWGVANTSC